MNGFNGLGYDPAWQQFAKGKGPFTIAGTWITHDALKALGDKLGFFLMPGREAGATRSRSAARACRGRSPRSPRTPTWRPPTSTSSRTPRRPTAGRDRQPAGDAAEQAARGAGQQGHLRRLEAAQRHRRPGAVHGLRDADVLRRLLGRRAAAHRWQDSRRTRSRRPCRPTTRSSPTRCDEARAARRAAARGVPVPAAGAHRLRRCSCWLRCSTARGCRCSRGTA